MTTKQSLFLVALTAASALMLGGALGFQYLGYAPCKMCYWQRYPHAVAIVLGIFALMLGHRLWYFAGALALATTSGIGFFHAGVELGFWPGPSSCTGNGAGLTGLSGDALLSVENVPAIVMCDQVSWAFMGLSMAMWNGLISAGLALAWLWMAVAKR